MYAGTFTHGVRTTDVGRKLYSKTKVTNAPQCQANTGYAPDYEFSIFISLLN